jgi:hypothetical protein
VILPYELLDPLPVLRGEIVKICLGFDCPTRGINGIVFHLLEDQQASRPAAQLTRHQIALSCEELLDETILIAEAEC